jgi:hypothetical protein
VTLLVACTPIYYVPNAPTVPLITEKGEGDLSVSVAREGAHFQTSYGFTNSIAAFTNIQIGPSREWNGNRQISTDQYEMGLGVFSGKRRFTVWELYAIGGLGRIQNELPERNGLFGPQSMGGALDANFWRYGFQLNYGLKRDNVEFAVSNRIFLKTYYNISGDLMFENVPQVDFLRINNRHFYWEPALTFKYGWRNFKIFIHTIVSGNITDPDFYRLGSNGMIGVSYQW